MKFLSYALFALFLFSCKKEKTFADDIKLSFPKAENLSFQKFNEDANEMGTSLIYIGKIKSNIEVEYYSNIISEPPPPPKINENAEDYLKAIKHHEDSIQNANKGFFRNTLIKILETKEEIYDSLIDKKLSIIVKERDTIPLYTRDYGTNQTKKHKAFPVFIKNISSKTLRIPVEAQSVALYVQNNNQYQYIRNSNYMICGTGTPTNLYFELKPSEILIYSFPHLNKGQTRKAKISFFKAYSSEFKISIDENIIKNQRSTHYLQ